MTLHPPVHLSLETMCLPDVVQNSLKPKNSLDELSLDGSAPSGPTKIFREKSVKYLDLSLFQQLHLYRRREISLSADK